MSCWRHYQCDVLKDVDKSILKDSLKELGFELDESVQTIRGYEGQRSKCDAQLIRQGTRISVGITYSGADNKLEIEGDFWNSGFDHQSIIQQLAQTYQKMYITQQLELNGYTVDSVETNADGEIEIEAYCWSA